MTNNTPITNDLAEDEISLLDLLQTIVDNLRLLVIGPVVAGLVAYGVTLLIPKTYESTAILKGEQNLASQMVTASVLDPVAAKLGYAQLIGVIEKTQESQIRVEKELKGIDGSDLIQSPTLPTKKIAPKRTLIAITAALAVGFVLLLFVFIRQAMRNASQNEESAQKINALQAAWRKALGRAA